MPKAEEEGEYLVISADGNGYRCQAVEEPASVAHACSRRPKPEWLADQARQRTAKSEHKTVVIMEWSAQRS